MSQETKPTTSPETPQNTELVAKIRAVIESHTSFDEYCNEFIPELDFDDLAQAIAETFSATTPPQGNDSSTEACYRLCSSESVACTCAAPNESKLIEKLKTYAWHVPSCPKDVFREEACSCGFDAVVSALESRNSESPSVAPNVEVGEEIRKAAAAYWSEEKPFVPPECEWSRLYRDFEAGFKAGLEHKAESPSVSGFDEDELIRQIQFAARYSLSWLGTAATNDRTKSVEALVKEAFDGFLHQVAEARLRCSTLQTEPAESPSRAPTREWKDPTLEMLNDPLFNRIWDCIKSWDINVPEVYVGYCGATGNHVRAIFEAVNSESPSVALSDDELRDIDEILEAATRLVRKIYFCEIEGADETDAGFLWPKIAMVQKQLRLKPHLEVNITPESESALSELKRVSGCTTFGELDNKLKGMALDNIAAQERIAELEAENSSLSPEAAQRAANENMRIDFENGELRRRIAELEAALSEEQRLNGMGSEREARLMARVAELERDLKETKVGASVEARARVELEASDAVFADIAEDALRAKDERIAELEAALSFYADAKNYEYDDHGMGPEGPVYDDEGEHARKALRG